MEKQIFNAKRHPEHVEKIIYDDEGNRYVHFREDLRKDGLSQKQEFKDKIIYISNPERSEHHASRRIFIRESDNTPKKIETTYDENYTKKGLQKTEFHPETGKVISHTYNPEKHPKHMTQEIFNENNIKIEEHFDPNLAKYRLFKRIYNPQTGLRTAKIFKPTESGFKLVQIHYDNAGKGTPVFGIIKKIKSNSEN